MRNAVGAVDSVLLLGGRSDIGLAIVRRLVADGARRVVLAQREGRGDERSDGPKDGQGDGRDHEMPADLAAADVHVVDFDIDRPDAHRAVLGDVFDQHGDFDVVVDAIGVLGDTDTYEADPARAANSVVTNFGGHVSAGLVVADRLRAQGHGTFVVLSSVAGVRVRRANYVYGAAKAGLDGFAHGLGDRLAGSGASVLVVRPGFVRSQLTSTLPDAPFTVKPDVVADAVADGIRQRREVVWVPAKLRVLFGLLRLLPRAVWRRLPR